MMRAKEIKKRKESFKEFGGILVRRHGQNYSSSYDNHCRVTTDEAATRFGRYLRAARANRGLTIVELAAQTNISKASLIALEQGIILACDIKPKWLKDLAKALGENVEDFNLILGRKILSNSRWSWLNEVWLNFTFYAPKQNLFYFIYSEFNSLSKPIYAVCSALLICFIASLLIFLETVSFDQPAPPQPETPTTIEAKATQPRPERRFTMERTEFDYERQAALTSPAQPVVNRWTCCIY
jgi:transcriptional regulator with XRE-family HTH domain